MYIVLISHYRLLINGIYSRQTAQIMNSYFYVLRNRTKHLFLTDFGEKRQFSGYFEVNEKFNMPVRRLNEAFLPLGINGGVVENAYEFIIAGIINPEELSPETVYSAPSGILTWV